ncbi:MAG TPA: Gfo/Idh/MocA family oxidoreductase [Armatimonadota bacterium]|nr:Gfo/Idh/MocA family oxidoreductase [Armatimonadota bacterium]
MRAACRNERRPGRFVLQMAHFLECIRDGRQPRVTGEDGLAAMKVIEAAYRSVETSCAESPEITMQE